MAFSFWPELAVECSMLGRVFLSPSITDERKVNATLAWAKANPYVLKYLPGAKRLVGFADSAGPTPQGTQGGRLFALTNEDGFQVCAWICWESRKVKRVCSSSNTGELLSRTEAFDTSMWLQQLWFELTGNKVPVELVIDSNGTSQNAATTLLPAERRSRTDMSKHRQGLRRGEYIWTWVPGRANLSDPMTKEILGKGGSPLTPCERLKKPCSTHLEQITQISRELSVSRKLKRTCRSIRLNTLSMALSTTTSLLTSLKTLVDGFN
jgi:hypothetical protein